MCSREHPCGGVLYDDGVINHAMALRGFPQRVARCMNAHAFWSMVSAAPSLGTATAMALDHVPPKFWCKTHDRARPCRECSAKNRKGRDALVATLPILLCRCGTPAPQGRKYCSDRCENRVRRDRYARKARPLDPVARLRTTAIAVVPRSRPMSTVEAR